MPGIDSEKVITYQHLLDQELNLDKKVAIMGAGGIGFDVGEYLSHEGASITLDTDRWHKEWGVDITNEARGGLVKAEIEPSPRKLRLIHRNKTRRGREQTKIRGRIN